MQSRGKGFLLFPKSQNPKKTRFTIQLPILEIFRNDEGQDIAEYAVMLAAILVIVVGTIRLVGSNANSVFSQAASSIQ